MNTGQVGLHVYKNYYPTQMGVERLRLLEENPHYKYPGMALPNGKIKPLDVCWGSDKTYYIGSDKQIEEDANELRSMVWTER